MHKYIIKYAIQEAQKSEFKFRHGCVIFKGSKVISTGYNGSIKGLPHCDEAGHEMVDGHCIRTTHAEANAIAQAAKNGVGIKNGC